MENKRKRFTFVVDPSDQEIVVYALTEKVAHRMVWDLLSDNQKNSCASIECVDQREIAVVDFSNKKNSLAY